MRFPVIAMALVGFLLAGVQQQDEPWAPHDPQHREPPAGWMCARDHVAQDHVCECTRECKTDDNTDPSEDGPPIVEDARCAVYCHPKHCSCPVRNCP